MPGSDVSLARLPALAPLPAHPTCDVSGPGSDVGAQAPSDGPAHRDAAHAPHPAPHNASLPHPLPPSEPQSLRGVVRVQAAPAESLTPDDAAFAAAVAQAKARGLGQLTREVGASSHFARTIVSRMTLAGLGLAVGLLFAGQPMAVVLVVPAMAAIGVGLRALARRRLNNGTKPHVEAFKALMAQADETTRASPEYARARVLYTFLVGKNVEPKRGDAQAHLADAYGAAGLSLFSNEAIALASAAPDADHGAYVHALTQANLDALDASEVSHHSARFEAFEHIDVARFDATSVTFDVTSDPAVRSFFGDHAEDIAAWHRNNPGVDPTHSFDERDIASYEEIKRTIRTLPAPVRAPTWALTDRVFKALGLDVADRDHRFTAGALRARLGLEPSSDDAPALGHREPA